MDVPIRMRTISNVTHCYAISLKSGDKFLYYLIKVTLKEKASICYTIKENLLLSGRKFPTFVVVIIM